MTTLIASDEQRVNELCDQLLAEHDPKTTPAAEFLGAQFDLGLAWVHFPEGNGGLGLTPKLMNTINTRVVGAGGPIAYARNPIGYGMCAPTIVTHGSEAQKQRYLRPLFTGEEVWCQLFSEPGAGSDVASLAMRAIQDGDEWTVNGQKVWTTLAHVSAFGIVLARTNPDSVKHKGMTMFVVDMHAPGVEVRPLVQATGEAEFNEVYMTDVRIPDDERLGDVGEGWGVSLTTLMNERVSIGGQVAPRGGGIIALALRAWEKSSASRRRGRARSARAVLDRGRGRPAHEHARVAHARQGDPGTRGFGRQDGDGRPEPTAHGVRHGAHGPGGDALSVRLPDGPADDRDGPLQPAEGVHSRAGQLHRGWHDEHHEEHPRRARPRPARRAPGRQGRALERSAPQLTARPADPARVVPLGPIWGGCFSCEPCVS